MGNPSSANISIEVFRIRTIIVMKGRYIMNIALSVLFGDQLFYFRFPSEKSVIIADSDADISIHDFGYRLIVKWNSDHFDISVQQGKNNSMLFAQLNEVSTIDESRRIALFFSVRTNETHSFILESDAEYYVGRSSKASDDGHRNNIVIDLPFISRFHFIIKSRSGKVYVEDLNSKNGLHVNGEKIKEAYLWPGDTISILTVQITLRGNCLLFENVGDNFSIQPRTPIELRKSAPIRPINENEYRVERRSRTFHPVAPNTITLQPLGEVNTPTPINWLNVLVTPLITVTLMLVLVFALGMSPVMLIMSGTMSVVSAVMAIINYQKQKKEQANAGKQSEERYYDDLHNQEVLIQSGHFKQLKELEHNNPAPGECVDIVNKRDDILWARMESDDDFLFARLGTGTIEAAVKAQWQAQGYAHVLSELESEAKRMADESSSISNAPVLYDVLGNKATGILGEHSNVIQLTRSIVTGLTTTHPYDKLKIIILISKDEANEWRWMRWLPHCQSDDRQLSYLFTDKDEAKETLDEIELILTNRSQRKNGYQSAHVMPEIPCYLLIVSDNTVLNNHPVKNLFLSNAALGCCALFLNKVPSQCQWNISLKNEVGEYYNKKNGSVKQLFQLDVFSTGDADRFAREMAPLYIDSVEKGTALPDRISFLEGYRVSCPDELSISKRWKQARTYESLSVPIGVKEGDERFYFDIHKKKHGSHGIVAAMTQYGKTDMVVAWLLSLAVNFSPSDVSFVLVDWKGISMISPFYDFDKDERLLPHLAGKISNLDVVKPGYVDRCLRSLNHEIVRRQQVFKKYNNFGVKDIEDLTRLYNKGIISECLPRLMVVIDEYGQFKTTYPNFGATIDALTKTGSSLGISLVLTDQSAAQVITPATAANIKFRWCLHVANTADSKSTIGTDDAYYLNKLGRAIVSVSPNVIYETIQVFWPHAVYNPKKETRRAEISTVQLNGIRHSCEPRVEKGTEKEEKKESQVIVEAISDCCQKNNIPFSDEVWKTPLPERIALTDIMQPRFNGKLWQGTEDNDTCIGIVDDPDNQAQYELKLNLAKEGHFAVYGDPGTGKTTLLQTLIMSLALSRSPDEVNIYIIDFGGGNMTVFSDLPHVGGIVYPQNMNKLQKLIMLINNIILARQNSFSLVGAKDITNYRHILDKKKERIPDIYLIVDNISALINEDPNISGFLAGLTGSAANYGIYLVATASQNGIPFKIENNIASKIALEMQPLASYTNIVGKVSSAPPKVKGRGFIKGSPPLEFQTALPAPGNNDIEISDNIRRIVGAMCKHWKGDTPEKVPVMPDIIKYGTIKSRGIVLGLSENTVQPLDYDYKSQHFLLISGTAQSGKTNLLQVVSRQLKEKLHGELIAFAVKGNGKATWSFADKHLSKAQEIDSFFESLRPELQNRQKLRDEGKQEEFDPIIFAIDDYESFYTPISVETVSRLWAIAKLGKNLSVFLLVAGDGTAINTHFNKGDPIITTMINGNQAVMLGGSMLSHPAINTTAGFAQKGIQLDEHYGYYVKKKQPEMFKTMFIKGENER